MKKKNIKPLFAQCFLDLAAGPLCLPARRRALMMLAGLLFFPFLPACDNFFGIEREPDISEEARGRGIAHPFLQGDVDHLYALKKLDGKSLKIKTSGGEPAASLLTKASGRSCKNNDNGDCKASDGLRIEDEGRGAGSKDPGFISKFHQNLRYEAESGDPLLKGLLPKSDEQASDKLNFKGVPGKKHDIVFRAEGDYLILYKRADSIKDIPYTERTAAASLDESGRLRPYSPEFNEQGHWKEPEGPWMTPFIGYKIQYCRPEPVRNSDNEETSQNRPDCAPERDDSIRDYIRLSKTWEKFTFLGDDNISQKQDLFPSDYFGQEDLLNKEEDKEQNPNLWYFAKSLIKAPAREGGHTPPHDAKLIRFEKKSGRLEMLDMSGKNIDDREILPEKMPVFWETHAFDKKGGKFKNFGERKDERCDFRDCPYARIDFSGKTSFSGDPYPISEEEKISVKEREIKEIVLSKDYFSLTFESKAHTLKFFSEEEGWKDTGPIPSLIEEKWSFLRAASVNERHHKPRRFFLDDLKYFGVFAAYPQRKNQVGDSSIEDYTEKARLKKMAPNDKGEIIWRFSSITPKDEIFRDIGKKAVKLMNQAFQKAGEGSGKTITVMLEEGYDPDLGDIRYNLINIAPENSAAGGTFGLGPSYANPDTGQIISATANIWIRKPLEYYIYFIRQYIRYELFQKGRRSGEDNHIHGASPFIREKISAQCPDIEQWITPEGILEGFKAKNRPDFLLPDTYIEWIIKDSIIDCARTIYQENALAVLIHEMGHNFGLMHNFKGSAGEAGFYKSKEEIENIFPGAGLDNGQIAQTSSMMDYLPLDVPQMTVPGTYDIAALRYLYFDRVEKEDGTLADLPWANEADPDKYLQSQKSLDDLGITKNMRKHSYCDDYDLGWPADPEDPLCAVYDYGSSPKKAAEFQIENIIRDAILNRYRYDNSHIDNIARGKNFSGFRMADMPVYSNWHKLSSGFWTETLKLFKNPESMADEYKGFLNNKLNEADISNEYKLYYEIREPVFDFLLRLAFMPEAKCHIMDNETKRKRLIPLERIKRSLFDKNRKPGAYVIDCSSPLIGEYLEKENKTLIRPEKLTGEEFFYNTGLSYMMDKSERVFFDVAPPFSFVSFLVPDSETKLSRLQLPVFEKALREPDFFARFRKALAAALLGDKESGVSFLSPPETRGMLMLWNSFISISSVFLNARPDSLEKFHKSHSAKIYDLKDFKKDVFDPLNNALGSDNEINGIQGCGRRIADNPQLSDKAFAESMWPCYISRLKNSGASAGAPAAGQPGRGHSASGVSQPAEAAGALLSSPTARGFWNFITNSGGLVIKDKTEHKLITPLSRSSLAARLICKYKENRRRIDEIEKFNSGSADDTAREAKAADSNCMRLRKEDLEETEGRIDEIAKIITSALPSASEKALEEEQKALEDKKQSLMHGLADNDGPSKAKEVMPEGLYELEELENHNQLLLEVLHSDS